MGVFDGVETIDELIEFLTNFTTYEADPDAYDFGGIVIIWLACLDNFKRQANDGDYQSLGAYMTEDQREFFLELAEYVRNYVEEPD